MSRTPLEAVPRPAPTAGGAPAEVRAPIPAQRRAPDSPGDPRWSAPTIAVIGVLIAADLLAVTLSTALGGAAVTTLAPDRAGVLNFGVMAVVVVATLVAVNAHHLSRPYTTRLRPSGRWRLSTIAGRLPAAVLLALAASAVLPGGRLLSLTAGTSMVAPAVLLVPLARRVALRLTVQPVSRVLVLGTGDVAERVTRRLRRCADILVVGQVDDEPLRPVELLGGVDDLPQICVQHRIDRVVVAFTKTPTLATAVSLQRLAGLVPVSVVPRMFELHCWRSHVEELHGIPLLDIAPPQRGRTPRLVKRGLDLGLSVVALLALALPALAVAALIKLDSPGPVFFRQERTGRGGRTFRIYKFRTMVTDAEARRQALLDGYQVDGPLFKLQTDPRVTAIGGLLRRTSIDELPQLINVVRGEMSLVGPRPLPVVESAQLDGAALARFEVPPGITGLWQVSGRSDLSYADLQHLDAVYVHSWSLRWDLRILLSTPGSVLTRRGAY